MFSICVKKIFSLSIDRIGLYVKNVYYFFIKISTRMKMIALWIWIGCSLTKLDEEDSIIWDISYKIDKGIQYLNNSLMKKNEDVLWE